MNKAELRRRARLIAAELIDGDVEAGLDVASYTDDGSDGESEKLAGELRAIAAMLRRVLPPGYRIDPDPDVAARRLAAAGTGDPGMSDAPGRDKA